MEECAVSIIDLVDTNEPNNHDLDNLAGTWNEKDVKEFRENVEDLERIDKEIWI